MMFFIQLIGTVLAIWGLAWITIPALSIFTLIQMF